MDSPPAFHAPQLQAAEGGLQGWIQILNTLPGIVDP